MTFLMCSNYIMTTLTIDGAECHYIISQCKYCFIPVINEKCVNNVPVLPEPLVEGSFCIGCKFTVCNECKKSHYDDELHYAGCDYVSYKRMQKKMNKLYFIYCRLKESVKRFNDFLVKLPNEVK